MSRQKGDSRDELCWSWWQQLDAVLPVWMPLTKPGQHAEAGSKVHRHEARDGQDRMLRVE